VKFKNVGRQFVGITYRAAGVRERRRGDILWQAYLRALSASAMKKVRSAPNTLP